MSAGAAHARTCSHCAGTHVPGFKYATVLRTLRAHAYGDDREAERCRLMAVAEQEALERQRREVRKQLTLLTAPKERLNALKNVKQSAEKGFERANEKPKLRSS